MIYKWRFSGALPGEHWAQTTAYHYCVDYCGTEHTLKIVLRPKQRKSALFLVVGSATIASTEVEGVWTLQRIKRRAYEWAGDEIDPMAKLGRVFGDYEAELRGEQKEEEEPRPRSALDRIRMMIAEKKEEGKRRKP